MDDNYYWHTSYCNESLNFVCGVPGVGASATAPASSITTTLPVISGQSTISAELPIGATASGSRSLECPSYIPLSFDVSKKLNLSQFNSMRKFIFNMLSEIIQSNDTKPAAFSTYGTMNYPFAKFSDFIGVIAYVEGTSEQSYDDDSDFTK